MIVNKWRNRISAFFQRRKIKVFLFFVIFSLVTWFMNKLSKEYTTTIECKATIANLSDDRFLYDETPIKLPVNLTSHGFRILGMQLFGKHLSLDGSRLSATSNRDYLIAEDQLAHVIEQFPADVKVVNIDRDTLYTNTSYTDSKTLALRPDITIEFRKGYGYVDQYQLSKDSIKLIGPKAQLDSIHQITTEPVILVDVAEDIELTLQVKTPFGNHIRMINSEVVFSAAVDRYTEEIVEVPIIVEGLPEGKTIRLFPKTAKVIYAVGQKDLAKVDESKFRVVCHFLENDQGHLEAILVDSPSVINTARIENTKIDYLIRE